MTATNKAKSLSTPILLVDVQIALPRLAQRGRARTGVSKTVPQQAPLVEEPPSAEQLTTWASSAFLAAQQGHRQAELTLRIVGKSEITELNRLYRQQDKPTNVLSFAFDDPLVTAALDTTLLGDVLICHPVLVAEAKQQNKTMTDHYAHMVVHGVLHLLGYDHQNRVTAEQMEALEINILAQHDIADPYDTN